MKFGTYFFSILFLFFSTSAFDQLALAQSVGVEGESCRSTSDCSAGLQCMNRVCQAISGVRAGGYCEARSDCAHGLRCMDQRCVEPERPLNSRSGELGTSCSETQSCQAGLACISSICTIPALNASCTKVTDCQSRQLTCIDGICRIADPNVRSSKEAKRARQALGLIDASGRKRRRFAYVGAQLGGGTSSGAIGGAAFGGGAVVGYNLNIWHVGIELSGYGSAGSEFVSGEEIFIFSVENGLRIPLPSKFYIPLRANVGLLNSSPSLDTSFMAGGSLGLGYELLPEVDAEVFAPSVRIATPGVMVLSFGVRGHYNILF